MDKKLTKPQIIVIVIAIIAVIGMIFLPEFLSQKKTETTEDETEDMLPVSHNKGQELVSFEKETARQRSFEELTPDEKALLYAQAQQQNQEMTQEMVQTAVDNAMKQQVRQQQTNALPPANQSQSVFGASTPPAPMKWYSDNETSKLLDKDFTAATNYYKGQSTDNRWIMSSGAYQAVLAKSNNITNAVDVENINLFSDDKIITTETSHVIPSGTYLSAITTGFTDSDYPEAFVATMSRPSILRGWKILCKSGGNSAGRVFITPDRLISPEGKEIAISGQIEMASVPGMTGDKHSRWFKRMAPSMINAGIGGGLLAYQMRQEQKDRDTWAMVGGTGTVGTPVGTVVTPDASSTSQITEPIIQDGISGLQKEITRSFQQGNIDDQVKIHAGTVFDILLLSPLTINL